MSPADDEFDEELGGGTWEAEADDEGWDDDQWDDEDYEDYLAREFPDQAERRPTFGLWQWTAIGLLAIFLLYVFAGLW